MTLHDSELFQGLARADAEAVAGLGRRVRVPSGSELFPLGGQADSVFVVERGRIALTLPMKVHSRDEDVLIEERSPGQAFGWSALIPPHRFTLKASAPLDSEVLAIPRDALLAHFAAHPEVALVMTRNVAEVMGRRLQVFQTMWLREMQRVVDLRTAPARGTA